MKIKIILFLILFCCFDTEAQELPSILEPGLSTKEYRQRKKVLKDTARTYYWNLEKFEELLRSRGQIQQQNQEQDSLLQVQQELLAEIERLKKVEENADSLASESQRLKAELNEISQVVADYKKNVLDNPQNNPANNTLAHQQDSVSFKGNIPDSGVYFTIQIGAYRNDNLKFLSQKAEGQTIFTEKAEGLNKYLIGLFEDYEEAQNKMIELLKMGLPEAWVVAYKDGQRVTLSQAKDYTASVVENSESLE